MSETSIINFASDNAAPVCPQLMEALARENAGPALGYGNDNTTRQMEERFRDLFGCNVRAFPVSTGTAANVLGLGTLAPPYGSIYCHTLSHIQEDECGAPEFFSGGAKLALLDGEDGKLTAEQLDKAIATSGKGVVHHVQPAVISLTQATEAGTIYQPEEVRSIGDVAKHHGLSLHMDGARFANAVVSLGCEPADITWKAGVDVLSFGATKNGAMAVEAVIYFNADKAEEFEFRRKRGAHLFSKLRYLSAQLDVYLRDGLWLENASQANRMADRLATGLRRTGYEPLHPVEANILFVSLPLDRIRKLEQSGFLFYVMGKNGEQGKVRLVTSWDTTEQDVDLFLSCLG